MSVCDPASRGARAEVLLWSRLRVCFGAGAAAYFNTFTSFLLITLSLYWICST